MGELRNARWEWLRVSEGARVVSVSIREDGQILHRQSKDQETGSNNGQGDGDFGPLRKIFSAGGRQHASDGHIHAVGNKPRRVKNRTEIEAVRLVCTLRRKSKKHGNGEQANFQEKEIRFRARLQEQVEHVATHQIDEAEAEIKGEADSQDAA